MRTIIRRLIAKLGVLTSAPQQISEKIDDLKTSPGGRKLIQMDTTAGRIYSRFNAAFWFAICAVILAIVYIAGLLSEGWVETTIIIVAAGPFLAALWFGVSHLRNPQTASDILVEELEDRARPVKWLLQVLKLFSGRRQSSAEQR